MKFIACSHSFKNERVPTQLIRVIFAFILFLVVLNVASYFMGCGYFFY